VCVCERERARLFISSWRSSCLLQERCWELVTHSAAFEVAGLGGKWRSKCLTMTVMQHLQWRLSCNRCGTVACWSFAACLAGVLLVMDLPTSLNTAVRGWCRVHAMIICAAAVVRHQQLPLSVLVIKQLYFYFCAGDVSEPPEPCSVLPLHHFHSINLDQCSCQLTVPFIHSRPSQRGP